jgi:RNA polymerase sigma-70 factor (ECF subfamily)
LGRLYYYIDLNKKNQETRFFALIFGVQSDNITDTTGGRNLEVDLWHVRDEAEIKLVEAAVGGNIDSFGELCGRYYVAMVSIGYSFLGDHQLAEDAAQESFARALVHLSSLKKRTRFAPWLAAICRNVAKDMLTAKAKRRTAEDISQVTLDSDSAESTGIIREAIRQLPASARELLVLRYYNGLSYEQIGCVLGISKSAINGRLARAKRKLADYLKRSDFPENKK